MEKVIRNSALLMVVFFLVLVTQPASAQSEVFPRFPWFTYGSLTDYFSGEDVDTEGRDVVKLDGYIEQGVDWFRIGSSGPIVNTFVGLSGTWSNIEEHWWDNKFGPWFGLKLKMPVKYGELALGVRGEYYEYYGNEDQPYDNELKGGVYLQWYFGGDWR